MKQNDHRRLFQALALALCLLLAVSLVPILRLSQYSRPAYDDYGYGLFTHRALESGGSLFAAVWYTVKQNYLTWQGSFAAMALMSLTPLIFSEQLYWITTVVMLASLIFGTVKLSHTLVCRMLKGEWWQSVLICVPMLLLSIQFVPSPWEAFYWWNGAVYYTFTYGISLLYMERLLSLFCAERPSTWKILLPGVLWGVLVGGSNYVSALLCTMLGVCLLLFSLWKKRERAGVLTLFLSEVIPFCVSVFSPGNQVRQAGVTSMSPVMAIVTSIGKAAEDLATWPTWLTLTMVLLWAPVLFQLAGKSGLRFRFPLVFAAVTFLFFAAQNAPHFYAVSIAGPGRLRDIVYYSHFWVILLDEWYFLGWFRRAALPRLARWERHKKTLAAGGAALVVLLSLGWGWFYSPIALSVNCAGTIKSGAAAAFAQQWDARLVRLKDPADTDPVFEPLKSIPSLLASGDLMGDPQHWVNQGQAWYYGKNSVSLKQ